jgi:hypothetical protein
MAGRIHLTDYTHPHAQLYLPQRAALFIQPIWTELPVTAYEWPLDAEWLNPPDPMTKEWTRMLEGKKLDALLAVRPRNMGSIFFQHAGQMYEVYLVPWLPGTDLTEQVPGWSVPFSDEELLTALPPTPTLPSP